MTQFHGAMTMTSSLDYIRLATWDDLGYTNLVARLMSSWPADWKQAKWLQYKGWRKDTVFIGQGMQQGRLHCIFQASGTTSQMMLQSLKTLGDWYCTRLDLQITVDAPLNLFLADVRDSCETKNTTLIESPENHTLYIGSRGSALYTRLYEKVLDRKYLRLEFELKAERSRSCWQAICKGESLDKIFNYYTPKTGLPESIIELFATSENDVTQHVMRQAISADNQKTLKWLLSLDAAVMKALANHDIADTARELVRGWAYHAHYLDRKEFLD